MSERRIVVDPVTRIEGHLRVQAVLGDDGKIVDSMSTGTMWRGLEVILKGRDPRDALPKPILRTDVLAIEDLASGMELMGTVRNVIDFGAFVDIGVHQDGLVHISRMADKFIRHPSEVVHVGDVVTVWVVDVDAKKQRIALSMVKGRT